MKLRDLVESLIKGKMGGQTSEAESRNILFALQEYSRSQRQRGVILGVILLGILITPVVTTQLEISPDLYPYLLGGSGVFAAGMVKILISAYQDLSRAHTLVVLCQGLQSTDARQLLIAWLKSK